MECPFCHQDNDKVVDSRASGSAIRRRRECLKCSRRYTTYERPESLRVIKKDGTREEYDRSKIRRGLMLALHKRPVPTERLDEMLREIENELMDEYPVEVSSATIGDLVMKKLAKEDQVAYVRFASVYRNFKDVSEFVQEVQPMLTERGREKGKEKEKERTEPRPAGGEKDAGEKMVPIVNLPELFAKLNAGEKGSGEKGGGEKRGGEKGKNKERTEPKPAGG